ncbi:HDOD domain-containing protein [Rhodoferax sp. GW822-FHT02A01]|uniref:HDOD domain-containing protein n=1 Tax=Rhodoferax sp. GW822-FHT02A01 TaxID=3141537 RepID=UPI00315DBA39
MADLESFFAGVRLPVLSPVTVDLISMLSNERATMDDICTVISKEPAIAARLLKLANSSQFGLPRSVGLLEDAVTLVGLERVGSLAIGASLSSSIHEFAGLDRHRFWTSAMHCAGYAQWLAPPAGIPAPTGWLTGMMLRLGQLLIAQAEPDILQAIEALPVIPGVRWQREQHLLGFTEGQITAEMAAHWNFPPQIVQGLRHAADPMAEDGFSRLGAVIHLAGLLAETQDASPDSIETLPWDVIAALELDIRWMRASFPDREKFVNVS